MTNSDILKLEFYSRDFRKFITIKEWLQKLLIKLIEQGEGFDGKRPFGNSDWVYDVAECFIINGIIKGEKVEDEDYYEYLYDDLDLKLIEIVKSI